MSEGNGNGRVNPLSRIFAEGQIRVAILDADGESTGVVGVFNPIEPRVKARYDGIVQKGFGGRKPKYDEGDQYVFPKVIAAIEGLTADDCGGLEPILFCQTTERGRQVLKILMNGYWTQTLPSTDEDSKKSQPPA